MLMLSTLGVIEAGIWIHGHNVAVRAADAAVDVARGSYGQPGAARDRATRLASVGGLRDVQVTVAKGADHVSVTVSAATPSILDLRLGRISETAAAPVERVTQP